MGSPLLGRERRAAVATRALTDMSTEHRCHQPPPEGDQGMNRPDLRSAELARPDEPVVQRRASEGGALLVLRQAGEPEALEENRQVCLHRRDAEVQLLCDL